MATIEPRLIHLLNSSGPDDIDINIDTKNGQDVEMADPSPASSTATVTAHTYAPSNNSRPFAQAASLSPPMTLSSPSSSSSSLSSCADYSAPLLPPMVLCDNNNTKWSTTTSISASTTILSSQSAVVDDDLAINPSSMMGSGRWPEARTSTTIDTNPFFLKVLASNNVENETRAKNEFMQLPQPPVKKQRAMSSQQVVMPPIINGLHEPPHQSHLLPPITGVDDEYIPPPLYGSTYTPPANTSSDLVYHHHVHIYPREPEQALVHQYHEQAHYNHNHQSHHHHNAHQQTTPSAPPHSPPPPPPPIEVALTPNTTTKARRRPAKPRRKWSETETLDLLMGVSKHGVGKWTVILDDPQFAFNHRSAGDLKDRFRTCCPEELRRNSPRKYKELKTPRTPPPPPPPPADAPDLVLTQPYQPLLPPDSPEASRKTRAHRKKLSELAVLGIHGPFKQSRRRERRAFTEQEDRDILAGIVLHGPAWTKIHRDPQFLLSSRQPTDLRDRVRNKYPRVYASIEKGAHGTRSAEQDKIIQAAVAEATSAMGASSPESSPSPASTTLSSPTAQRPALEWEDDGVPTTASPMSVNFEVVGRE